MQSLFHELNSLDQACYDNFNLSSDLLMEHAAIAVANLVHQKFPKNSKILIVTGSGHNGADGLAVARLLWGDYNVYLFEYKQQKSELGLLQKERALAVGVHFIDKLCVNADVIIDGMFGSGLHSELDLDTCEFIQEISALKAYKIAIDLPSGVLADGRCSKAVFRADTTITMGAMKVALFADLAKDYTGEIKVANLGVSRDLYETDATMFLLDEEDMKLPDRVESNTHKGNFGHACFFSGAQEGASIMAGLACMNFGAGLVTLIRDQETQIPYELMQSDRLPSNATALCIGMGLGDYSDALHESVMACTQPLVIDADLFYTPQIKELLTKRVLLTPHPKEFCSLLDTLNLADIDVATLQNERFKYVKLFMDAYPNVCLLLKGSNVIIADNHNIYINPHGTAALSKGGSGDVLSGLITALLAQGYEPVQALISASLAHTFAARAVSKSSFGLTAKDLIKSVGHLGRN
jgi:ADP-dependent NAD(P)H-hydrate dehydratase / NAD(P)H-hydrate epimerase